MDEPAKKIQASSALNMAGPYLTTEASCPYCAKLNVLGHLESYNSLAKPLDVCGHLRAIEWNDDGERWVEFAAPDLSPAAPASAEAIGSAPAEAPQPANQPGGAGHPAGCLCSPRPCPRPRHGAGVTAQAAVVPSKPLTTPTASVEASWHTPLEWFVQCGGYRGEIMYYPKSMRWHARPRRGGFSRLCAWFNDMEDAIAYVAAA